MTLAEGFANYSMQLVMESNLDGKKVSRTYGDVFKQLAVDIMAVNDYAQTEPVEKLRNYGTALTRLTASTFSAANLVSRLEATLEF